MRGRGGGNSETHFTVEVVSKEFEGKVRQTSSKRDLLLPYNLMQTWQEPMQRHRLIYSTLQAELNAGLHALQIKAKTPDEAGGNQDGVEGSPASGAENLPAGP